MHYRGIGTLRLVAAACPLPCGHAMSQADDLQLRAEAFADLSIKFVNGLPDTLIARRLGAQYLDASTSVAANYRAARHGSSHDEFTAKIGVVSEEADESVLAEAPPRRKNQQYRCDGAIAW